MENHDVYTEAQESWIDSQYSELFTAFAAKDFESAEQIILAVEKKEFEAVANDMKNLLAQKKHHDTI